MDTYSKYNQIKMNPTNEEKMAFITNQGLYYYKVMIFSLKNVGATYYSLVNKMFKQQIAQNMEVYVNDLLVKSKTADQYLEYLKETFFNNIK